MKRIQKYTVMLIPIYTYEDASLFMDRANVLSTRFTEDARGYNIYFVTSGGMVIAISIAGVGIPVIPQEFIGEYIEEYNKGHVFEFVKCDLENETVTNIDVL